MSIREKIKTIFWVTKLYVVGGMADLTGDFELSRTNKHLSKLSVGANKWVFVKYFKVSLYWPFKN